QRHRRDHRRRGARLDRRARLACPGRGLGDLPAPPRPARPGRPAAGRPGAAPDGPGYRARARDLRLARHGRPRLPGHAADGRGRHAATRPAGRRGDRARAGRAGPGRDGRARLGRRDDGGQRGRMNAYRPPMARPRASRAGASSREPAAPRSRPTPAGIAAPPTADAATCRLTILVVPVVSVNSGKTGAAARPSSISPATASAPEPGPGTGPRMDRVISAAPSGTPPTAAARTRAGPRRSATGPSTTRPTHIIAQ